jgi:hypothetical protein
LAKSEHRAYGKHDAARLLAARRFSFRGILSQARIAV